MDSLDQPKKPLRILTIGDPHFKESNPAQTEAMVKRIVEIAKERQPDLIVCLGDVLDRHAKLHTDPLCEAVEFFRQLSNISHLYIIIGNHDRRTNTDFLSDRHPFTAVKYWKNVTVVERVVSKKINGHLLTMVPYVWPGRFVEALDTYSEEVNELDQLDPETYVASVLGTEASQAVKDKLGLAGLIEMTELIFNRTNQSPKKPEKEQDEEIAEIEEKKEDQIPDYSGRWWWKSSIIFAHQEFRGAKMGAIQSEKGDLWPLDGPPIISGHIHDYQRVQANVWYTGTPIQHAFGDQGGKTISLLNWSEQAWQEERIDLGLIKRKTIRMGILDLIGWTPPEGFLLKVVISGTPGELKTLSALSKIHLLRKNGILVTIKTLPDKPLQMIGSNGAKYKSVGYLIALWREVQLNEKMKIWFKNIFGGPARLDYSTSLIVTEEPQFPVHPEITQILDYLLSDQIPPAENSPRLENELEVDPAVNLVVNFTDNNPEASGEIILDFFAKKSGKI